MKLPNGKQVVVDIRKLRDYCLDPASPKGRSKARVFDSALGLTRRDAEFLRRALLTAVIHHSCVAGEAEDYGQRYTMDFTMETAIGRKRVQSGWMVRNGEKVSKTNNLFCTKVQVSEACRPKR